MLLFRYVIILVMFYFSYSIAEKPSVIIIGAGAAGIAAATKLLENSITNITILEAQDRIGGRIHSVKFGDTFVDLGAENCLGEEGNIVFELAKDYNILKSSNITSSQIFYSNGSKMDGDLAQDFEDVVFDYYNMLKVDKEKEDSGIQKMSKMSTGEAFIDRYKYLLKKYQNDSAKMEIIEEGLKYAEKNILLIDGAYSWLDISAENDYVDLTDKWDLVFKDHGFKTILDILMKNYPNSDRKLPIDEKIHLKCAVTRIDWNEGQGVTVHTSQNSYVADHVIFTASLGVLQRHKDTIFNPLLPQSKEEAIRALDFGSVAKIIAHFPDQWWDDDDNYFSFFWKEADLESVDFSQGPKDDGISWVTSIADFQKVQGNVWNAWICGDLVSEIEKQSLEVLKNGLQYVLNKFLGKRYNVTEADAILKTSWTTNVHFLGGFVNVRTGFYQKDLSYPERLAEPLNDQNGKSTLLFAGDATHPYFYSTVHGAIESGHREAERIIKFYNDV